MTKRTEKAVRPAPTPASIADESLKGIAGGSLHPVFPPGQFPSKGTDGWKPGWMPGSK